MKKLFPLSLFLLTTLFASATHNRAGEITYRVIDCVNHKYEITITTYTKVNAPADRPQLSDVNLGDNTLVTIPRYDEMILPDDPNVKRNRYIVQHTYPGPNRYVIHFTDPNRNQGVNNMIGSVNVPFYLETVLIINPFDGCNSSPVLNSYPIDRGCIGQIFIHNPFAVDPDGDSLSYQLTPCKQGLDSVCPGFWIPAGVTMNPVSGDLIWNTPQPPAGEYNLAFYIIEWRNGHPIDSVERDMQITIVPTCNNHPPQFSQMNDTCILAGDTLNFSFTVTDPDTDIITLSNDGSPFTVTDPATFSSNSPSDTVTANFTWITKCHHIRIQPYTAFFRAVDNGSPQQLVSLANVSIRVIAPPPQNLTAVATGNSIVLNWSPGACATDSGYHIWMRNDSFPGTFNCPCQIGVPGSSGFTLIGTVSGNNNTTFTDHAQHVIGVEYCYVVTAFFKDGSESCPSNQACAQMKLDLPVIVNASVLTTDSLTGKVFVRWTQPRPPDLDTIQYPPPYQYRLYHYAGLTAPLNQYTLVHTFFNLTDTSYVDTLRDTDHHPHSYRVEFYYDSVGTPAYAGETQRASTVFLSVAPTDERLILSWQVNVPWRNYFYEIYRAATFISCYDTTGLVWDSIGTSYTQTYVDSPLINGAYYRYYVKSVGKYSSQSFDTTYNNSEERCASPYDNVPPCGPHLSVSPNCPIYTNVLAWNKPDTSCGNDVMGYHIYYRSALVNDFHLLQTISDANDTTFLHSGLESIAGCYYVTAFDTNMNESTDYNIVCVDTCYQYYLPNVFSPDGSGLNDLLHPCDQTTAIEMQVKCPPYQNVKDVDIKFFNRWGELVFETTDREIKWNGKLKGSGKDCPEGVYYYTGVVNFISLGGNLSKDIHGFVHLIRKK